MTTTILTDIEGTTSSIAFVHDVLFPYAARTIPDYVRQHLRDQAVAAILDDVATEAGIDRNDTEALVCVLLAWIDEDRKATPLKTLQGLVWEAGYRDSAYRAHIYPDAADCLRRWHDSGHRLYVYSSGSIKAQRLFYGHTEAGDLQGLFSGYFDTTTGPKRKPGSYRRIAQAIATPPSEILFLSDVIAELDAARAAGLRTTWVRREADQPANSPDPLTVDHPTVRNFYGIDVD